MGIFKEEIQKDYVRHVRSFAAFLGRSPDTATSEDLRRFQLHMAKQQIGAPTINSAIAALRFFYIVTLERLRVEQGKGQRDRYANPVGARVAVEKTRPLSAQS
jgi:site-specific recombinase XerD